MNTMHLSQHQWAEVFAGAQDRLTLLRSLLKASCGEVSLLLLRLLVVAADLLLSRLEVAIVLSYRCVRPVSLPRRPRDTKRFVTRVQAMDVREGESGHLQSVLLLLLLPMCVRMFASSIKLITTNPQSNPPHQSHDQKVL